MWVCIYKEEGGRRENTDENKTQNNCERINNKHTKGVITLIKKIKLETNYAFNNTFNLK